MEDANWIGIVVCAAVSLLIGMLWYSPKVFGKPWMKSVGLTMEDAKKGNMPLMLGLSFVLGGVIAFALGRYAGYHDVDEQTFSHGMVHASLTFVFYVGPVIVITQLYEMRSLAGIAINVLYWFVTFCVLGGIMYAWPQDPPPPPSPEESSMIFDYLRSMYFA